LTLIEAMSPATNSSFFSPQANTHLEASDLVKCSMRTLHTEFDEVVNEFHNLKLTSSKAIEDKAQIIKSKEEEVVVAQMF